jgi:hypothetical protein
MKKKPVSFSPLPENRLATQLKTGGYEAGDGGILLRLPSSALREKDARVVEESLVRIRTRMARLESELAMVHLQGFLEKNPDIVSFSLEYIYSDEDGEVVEYPEVDGLVISEPGDSARVTLLSQEMGHFLDELVRKFPASRPFMSALCSGHIDAHTPETAFDMAYLEVFKVDLAVLRAQSLQADLDEGLPEAPSASRGPRL